MVAVAKRQSQPEVQAKVSYHVIRIEEEGVRGAGWNEAEKKVEAYFKRSKDPKPVEVRMEGKLAYRVTLVPTKKPKGF
jgi:hypothetical protein